MRQDFIAAVFVMLVIAGAFLLPPLWRGTRRSAFAVALVLPLAAVLLYWQIGNPLALDPAHLMAPQTLDQAEDALALQMRMKPDNFDGWMLLGASRKEQQRYHDASDAYVQALRLAPNDPALMVTLAETMTLDTKDRRIQGDALKLLQQAQHIDPRNQRALWFLGIAAYQQQHYAEAAATWEPLLAIVSAHTRPALRKQIDEARAHAGMPPLPTETPAAAGPALLTARVDITPALRAKLAPNDLLFVYARMPNGPPMPLAVKRVPAKDFPITIALADADGPMPTMRLSQQTTVDVQARVSHSGDALLQSGDFEAAPLTATVGANDAILLTIDRVHY
ncbi:MAG TPA: tetratricopeptide repeat protein [Xanthomonadaceae bacterium]|nr:tetratricopeptide repeat protein [Xanthomonadaceae bacterium]